MSPRPWHWAEDVVLRRATLEGLTRKVIGEALRRAPEAVRSRQRRRGYTGPRSPAQAVHQLFAAE